MQDIQGKTWWAAVTRKLCKGWCWNSLRILVCFALAGGPAAWGEEEHLVPPPRLAFVDGEVSFWRPGAEEWSSALVNTALAAGDRLYAGPEAKLEVQIGAEAWLRAAEETSLGLDNLERNFIQFRVTEGRVALDLYRLSNRATIEVATPHGALSVDRPGYYRVSVESDSTGFVARRNGSATIIPSGGGKPVTLAAGEQVIVGGIDSATIKRDVAPNPDSWDGWNDGRSDRLRHATVPEGVPRDLYGIEELGRYGTWREVHTYGRIWVPAVLPPGWIPYSTGRWMWDPYYGWTWVDEAPWGWAPFHYGRWVILGRQWAWAPGPFLGPPVYAPALVAFLDADVGVSVGIAGPEVAWVALGWGEPLVPWWGPPTFCGSLWWGGWYGPRIVDTVVVHHRHDHFPHKVRQYEHHKHGHGVVAVPREHFRHGERVGPTRVVPPKAVHRFRPPDFPLRIHPAAHSLAPGERPGRPHRAGDDVPVVATRPPRDPSPLLRQVGPDVPRSRHVERGHGRGVTTPSEPNTFGDSAPRSMPPRARAAGQVDRNRSAQWSVPEKPRSHGESARPDLSRPDARPLRREPGGIWSQPPMPPHGEAQVPTGASAPPGGARDNSAHGTEAPVNHPSVKVPGREAPGSWPRGPSRNYPSPPEAGLNDRPAERHERPHRRYHNWRDNTTRIVPEPPSLERSPASESPSRSQHRPSSQSFRGVSPYFAPPRAERPDSRRESQFHTSDNPAPHRPRTERMGRLPSE